MGTRKNRIGKAGLTCTHNVCFESKYLKIYPFFFSMKFSTFASETCRSNVNVGQIKSRFPMFTFDVYSNVFRINAKLLLPTCIFFSTTTRPCKYFFFLLVVKNENFQ